MSVWIVRALLGRPSGRCSTAHGRGREQTRRRRRRAGTSTSPSGARGLLCRPARCERPLLVRGWVLPASSSGVSLADSAVAVVGGTTAAETIAVGTAVAGCCTAEEVVVEGVGALETGAEADDEEPEVVPVEVPCLGVSVLPDRPCKARGEAVCGLLA